MNILLSYNWIKEFVGVKASADDFARRMSLSGPSFERSYPQAPPFANMVVGKITELKPHPNADRLHVAVTDLGSEKAEVVCGGVNLSVGMKVAVALPGAKVRWHGQGEPVTLEPAEIRGVKSAGMICGANEIGLDEYFPHAEKEIMDMSWCKAKPGARLDRALDLDDTAFDVEVTTNRPDAFCVAGIAREAATIMNAPFLWKETVTPSPAKGAEHLPLAVKVEAPALCTRYQAVVMDNVEVGPSPWWMKNRLRMAGVRPISNIVDITNYVMLELGQPMHAFDYDRLAGAEIRVRKAAAGERIRLLDGTDKELGADMLVIADSERPVAVAGVMGGEGSGVSATTRRIVFEAATFDPVSVRRTWRALNAQTDSSLRFEKGLPEELTQAALARAVELCQKVACGRVVSRVCDERSVTRRRVKFPFRPDSAERVIGIRIPAARMVKILKSLGFSVAKRHTVRKGKPIFDIEVPYWRARDIEGERDFAEEIARVYGYANLPSVLPAGEIPVRSADRALSAEDAAKRHFCSVGFTELYNYSFVSRDMLEKAGLDADACVRLANPLTADFEYMRPSLLPGLLATVTENQGLFPSGEVFEVSNVYMKKDGANLPDERVTVLVAAYGSETDDRLFRAVKGAVESYCRVAGKRVEFVRRAGERGSPPSPAGYGGHSGGAGEQLIWHPGRTVEIRSGETALGTLGEIHPSVLRAFGVDGRVCVAEFDLVALAASPDLARGYEPIPLFPPVRRDIAFVVDEHAEYARAESAIRAASSLCREVELFDVYRDERLGAGRKSFALHLTFQNSERTLTAEEADGEVAKIVKAIETEVGGKVRG